MRTLFIAALILSPALAQNPTIVSYPQDTLTGSSGNIVPLGGSTNGNFDEGRYQFLIPATHLPTPGGTIIGMAFNCQSFSGSYTYADLTFTLSHFTGSALTSTFASNLPAPQVVLSGGQTVNWTSRMWVPITFQTPFTYNGQDALVIDIQKTLDQNQNPLPTLITMETSSNPGRSDLPYAIANFGTAGSGAATGPTARTRYSTSIKARLLFAGESTMLLRSDRGGANNNVFAISQSVDVEVHAAPASAYVTFFDVGFQAPVTIPGIQGSLIVPPLNIFDSGGIPPTGFSLTVANIPNQNFLVGGTVVFQSITFDPATTVAAWTNGCDAIVNS